MSLLRSSASSALFLVAACAAAACGGQPPPASPASATEAQPNATPAPSAAGSAATAPQPASSSAAPAGDTASSGAAAADPNLAKATAFAKTFQVTDAPSLGSAPKDGIYGGVGDHAFVIEKVEIWIDHGNFSVRAFSDDASGGLGADFTIKGKPAAKKYSATLGAHEGYFQTPKEGKTVATKFEDTTSYNGENAWTLELTKVSIPKDKSRGTASGRFVVVFKGDDRFKPMWAAGTFTDAEIVQF